MNDLTDWDDDIIDQDKTGDGFIELTEIVEDKSDSEDDGTFIELTEIAEDRSDSEDDESFIELTEIAEDNGDDLGLDLDQEENDFVEGLDLQKKEEYVEESIEEIEEEIEDITIDLEDETNLSDKEIVSDEMDSSEELSISADQFEAALERVIEKKFADKIESILFEVMEKVIEKEISEIRESLQKDLDQIGDV